MAEVREDRGMHRRSEPFLTPIKGRGQGARKLKKYHLNILIVPDWFLTTANQF
ncbi:MAG: hypothetical protein HN867_14825 [Deltaproteobacteria bacterium]|nr:hypothetical protein [Deltaproteobacteria bacterium]